MIARLYTKKTGETHSTIEMTMTTFCVYMLSCGVFGGIVVGALIFLIPKLIK